MTNKSIRAVNDEVNKELADPTIGRMLLATTFKGLDETNMRKAILEGVVRGFTFKDFLEKNVYAIPYSNAYSLVTSIDYARKKGMRAGIVGKEAPVYVMDGKKIVSCAVTVHRKVGTYVGKYTAEVYFDEYYKSPGNKPSLWDTKPRTMIAKVAEMHALRMACPEELSQMYTEEEFAKDGPIEHQRMEQYTVARIAPPEELDEEQGQRGIRNVEEPIAEVVSEEKAPDEEPKKLAPLTPKQIKEMKLDIEMLLNKKAGYKALGKTKSEISDKIFDLFGCTYEEANYRFIKSELENYGN